MKTLISIVSGIMILASCQSPVEKEDKMVAYQDSVIAAQELRIMSLTDSVKYLKDRNRVIQFKADSLFHESLTTRFTYKQINRYIQLCRKNPTLNKFKDGWILRAIGANQ